MGDRLAGKVAIVTGAGSGIGRTTAIRFATEGAKVGCADRDRDGLDTTVEEIQSSGGQAVACEVDVTDEKLVEQMVAETTNAFGAVTVLYSNAGIAGSGNAGDLTLAEWEKVIAVNLTAVWLSSRACLPGMIEAGGGSIINQASVGGLIGIPGIASYAAAKAGVIGLTRQMAVEYGPSRIRVNAICPGPFLTPMNEPIAETEEGKKFIVGATALKRWGELSEIQGSAIYLASDAASYTTGSMLVVDGGWTAR